MKRKHIEATGLGLFIVAFAVLLFLLTPGVEFRPAKYVPPVVQTTAKKTVTTPKVVRKTAVTRITKIENGVHMTTTGPLFPASGTNDSAVGSWAWGSPGNATSSDGFNASFVDLGGGSQYLKVLNFSPGLASDQLIDGIEVVINKYSPSATDSVVQLVVGGVVVGSNLSTGDTWPTSATSVTYGSPTTLWGLTPSFANCNATDFGVVFAANGGMGTSFVDFITVTIYSHTNADVDAAIIRSRCIYLHYAQMRNN
ncbi:MAG: putative Ig protein [Planctomycetaceae bacterium]|nr:putative Ig protein [Planctomycetaceae bacterium]